MLLKSALSLQTYYPDFKGLQRKASSIMNLNTVETHIVHHPTNPIHNTTYFTSSNKTCARRTSLYGLCLWFPIANRLLVS